MPGDGSDIPLRTLNISSKLPLLENAAANDEPKSQLPSPKRGRGLLVHLPSKLRGIKPERNHRNVTVDHYQKNCFANAESDDKLNERNE